MHVRKCLVCLDHLFSFFSLRFFSVHCFLLFALWDWNLNLCLYYDQPDFSLWKVIRWSKKKMIHMQHRKFFFLIPRFWWHLVDIAAEESRAISIFLYCGDCSACLILWWAVLGTQFVKNFMKQARTDILARWSADPGPASVLLVKHHFYVN